MPICKIGFILHNISIKLVTIFVTYKLECKIPYYKYDEYVFENYVQGFY